MIKICGVRSAGDAQHAAAADALGLNFVPGRARAIDLDTARTILAATALKVIGVVADPDDALVEALLGLGIDTLQLHGSESPARCRELAARVRVVKAIAVRGPDDVRTAEAFPGDWVLFDAAVGGSGVGFDWDWLQAAGPRPYWLAGGLTPDNVATAIARTNAAGVDVASGVESSVGVKDVAKIAAFVARARQAFVTRGTRPC